MAINTYTTLQDAIDNWVIIEYGADRVEEFIALGEAELNRRLRVRDMEASTDLSITAGTREVALPTRFLGARRLYLDGSPVTRLKYQAPTDFWTKWISSETGKPVGFTIEGDNIVLGPSPDTTYTGKLLYWQGFPPLSDSQTTNDLLTNHPDAYLAAALFWAFTFKEEDSNIIKWKGILDGIIDSMELSDKRDRFSGDVLVQRTDTGNPPQFGS